MVGEEDSAVVFSCDEAGGKDNSEPLAVLPLISVMFGSYHARSVLEHSRDGALYQLSPGSLKGC